MKSDPDHDDYLRRWSEMYDHGNYGKGLAGHFLKRSHSWCERPFGPEVFFPRVLEVGAGTGMHLRYVRHRFDEYLMTDLNPPMLAKIRVDAHAGRVTTAQADATALQYPDRSFDRLIATHVLEHMPSPHLALREWARVLKPGGMLSLVLPCDPGMAWRIGRAVGSRGKFVRAGIDYDYWMAREHVNAINNLVAFVRYYFQDLHEQWMPLRVPSMDLNLFYIAHIRMQAGA